MIWDLPTLQSLHREYLAGAYPSTLAKRRKRSSAELIAAFRRHRLQILPKKPPRMPLRVPHSLVLAMHADYMAGMTFADVERGHSRPRGTIRSIFISRGLPIRPPSPHAWRKHRSDGTWEHKEPATESEITSAILASTKLVVPEILKLDWRKWPLARRGEFICRLKAHLNYRSTAPTGPYSSNVRPFDYCSPAAWKILTRSNAGKNSRNWALKMDICSEGVIYQGRLWFWNPAMSGYMTRGNRASGDTHWIALHRHIYKEKFGTIPAGMCVRFRDGNGNNLRPSNLYLSTRNEVCRENHLTGLNQRSAKRTSAILNLHHQPHQSNALAHTLSQPRKRPA